MLQLASGSATLRLSIHVIAACIWLGGQLTLAGLLPTVRSLGEGAPKKVAQAFGRLSWPAYWVLIATGFWNYAAVHGETVTSSWNTAFAVKMLCVIVAGVGSYVHTVATSPRLKGASAGIGALATTAALILGVALAG